MNRDILPLVSLTSYKFYKICFKYTIVLNIQSETLSLIIILSHSNKIVYNKKYL